MGTAVPASAPDGTAKPLRIVARVHLMPPEHNAGAEHMLMSMLRPLVERGHDVQVWLSRYGKATQPYVYRGVQVYPLPSRLDFPTAVRRADVLISHLECVPATSSLARGYGKPLIVICHNTHRPTFRDIAAGQTALAVYNSLWMEREAQLFYAEYPKGVHPDSTLVVRPPVFAEDYVVKKPGNRVTLINCYTEKGGHTLRRLAERMPDVQFLGVRGAYGEQVLPDLPNLELLGHVPGDQMRERVYARTKVLLMPSSYESWGRVGVEAMASGIPVVANPTPGLTESLADGGIFVEREDIAGHELVLRKLLGSASEYKLASKRAKARSAELDPSDELTAWCGAVEALAR